MRRLNSPWLRLERPRRLCQPTFLKTVPNDWRVGRAKFNAKGSASRDKSDSAPETTRSYGRYVTPETLEEARILLNLEQAAREDLDERLRRIAEDYMVDALAQETMGYASLLVERVSEFFVRLFKANEHLPPPDFKRPCALVRD
jgi:hypothetical protein